MESLRGFISEQGVKALVELSSKVSFIFSKDHYFRVGEHESERISEYHFSKWYHWKHAQRELFKSLLPEELIRKSFVCNFTRYDANTGFLDKIVSFKERQQSTGVITAIALFDNQQIIIEDTLHTLMAGDAIRFHVAETHEVPVSNNDALWVVTCQV